MSPWPERDPELTKLWNEKPTLSTVEIGRRMGMSKNAVLGRAHRLNLPMRPSPIARTGERKPCAVKMAALGVRKPGSGELLGPTLKVAKVRQPVVSYGPVEACCWPLGEPRTREFRYCDEPTVAGRSYCPQHMALAYVPSKYREIADAA